RIPDAPGQVRDHELPAWVRTAMLRRWERGSRPIPHRRDLLRGPVGAYRVLASRWPDQITAVIRSNGSFGSGPSLRAPATFFIQGRKQMVVSELSSQGQRVKRLVNRLRAS